MRSISTNVKLFVILVFTGAIFAFVMLWSLHLQNQMLERSLAQERRGNFDLVDKVVSLSSTALHSFANDYSLWDDMVQYVSTRDQTWLKVNIDPELAIFNFDVVWICDTTASPIYGVDIRGDSLASAFPLSAADRDSLIGNARFHHLFVSTQWGLLEIQQAPIQPTADSLRQSPAKGHFIVGKIWSPPYLKHFSELIGSQLSIEYTNERVNLQASQNINDATIKIPTPLQDLRGQTIAYLVLKKELTEWQSFRHLLLTQMGLILGFLAAALTVLALCVYFWVSRPLTAVSRSLEQENPESLGSLLRQKSEFGKLARLIRESVDQRRCFVEEIIERQDAQAALHGSEKRLSAITDSAKDGIIMLDADGNVRFWNPAAEEQIGYPADEIMGRNFQEVVVSARHSAEHRNSFASWQETALGNSVGKTLELSVIHKNGREIPVELSLSNSIISNQQYTIGIVRDITERNRAEDALRESEERYRIIMESVGLGVSLIDVNHKIIMANSFFANLFKKPAADFVGRYCFMEFEKRAAICPHCPGVLTMASGKPAEVETEGVRDDGSRFNVLIRTVPTFASDGTVSGFVEVIEDISERKRAQEALQTLLSRQEAILDAVPDMIMEVNCNKTYTWANQAGFEFFGGDVLGKEAAFYFEGEQETYANIQPLFEGKENVSYVESWQRRKDGQKRLLAWWCRVLKDSDGNVTGALSSALDISERKLAEENREKMLLRQQGISQLQQSLLIPAPIEDRLRKVTDTIVRLFDADFCRIWLIRPGDRCDQGCIHAEVKDGPHVCRHRDRCLHLLTSSGRYTHIDGQGHRRVPFGCYKIGLVASGKENKFVTNDAQNDPRVHNHAWVRELGLVSFAGYQLRAPGGETLGVLALFAKHPISDDEDAILEGIGSTVALVVKQAVAEESLHRSETKFRTLYDSTSDAVMLLDERGFFDCNKAALTIFGCATDDEFCSKHPTDLSPPHQLGGADSFALANQQIATAMEKGSNRFEWIHKRVDTGELFYADVLLNAMELNGKPVIQAVVRDITERKRAEEALQESQQMIEGIINSIPVRVFWKDKNLTYLGCNTIFARDAGFSDPKDIVGKDDYQMGWRDQAEAYRAADRQVIESGCSKLFIEEPQTTPAGNTITLLTSKIPLRNDKDEISGILGTYMDITERKLAAEVVLEQLRFLQVIIDAIPTPVYFKDTDGRYQGCNKAFADSLGSTRDDLIGKTVYDTTSPELAEHHTVADRELIEFGGTQIHESKVQYHDGTQHDVVSYKATYNNADGKIAGLVGTMLDITDRKRIEDSLNKALLRLRGFVESNIVGVVIAAADGTIIEANDYYLRLIGSTREELESGRVDWRAITPSEWLSADEKAIEELRDRGICTPYEKEYQRRDGTRVSVFLADAMLPGSEEQIAAIAIDITDRKRAEDELRKLSQAVEQSPTSVVITDVYGNIEYVNPKFCEITGYSSAEAIGQNPRILSSGKISKATYSQMWSTIRAGDIWIGEFLNRKKTGEHFWEKANISGIRDATGTITHYIALKEDITEQKRIEEERTRFIAVIDAAPESRAILKADGTIMYINHAFEKLSGIPSSRIVGFHFEAIMRNIFTNSVYKVPWDIVQTGESWTESITYRGIDGAFYLMDQSISPIRSQSGEIINYVVFGRDVTEERELEVRARWADERLRLSIDGMVDGLTLWDVHTAPDGSIQEFVCSEANPAALMMLGKERQDAIGCSVRELLKGAEDSDPHKLFLRVHERGQSLTLDHLHFLKDDRRLILTIHVWPIGTGVACHLRDVTQQLELEAQLRQAQKLEAVGSLAAGIAHEINTPIQFVGDNIRFLADSFSGLMNVLEHHRECREKMAPMLGEREELQQLRDLDKQVDVDYLKTEIPLAVEQSLEGVSRVSSIVRAMKDFSHIDEREMVLADINQMLDTTLTVARNELKYVADVAKDFASDLPTVECFRNDLNQVFLNLFINAAHAIGDVVSAEGQGRGTITVATRRDGDEVVISISDTGGGIPEGIRDRIFDHFFTTKEVGKGTGQGLSIARSIVVEKHKGMITFDSEIGKGTTFYIRLPIIRKEVEHVESQHPVRG
jgi:PAS domain S-box-containing protein